MYLLVATTRFLLGYDSNTRVVDVLESDQGEYYGITWSPKGDSLALSHSRIDNNSLDDLPAYANSECGYISLNGAASWPFLSQPHQILWIEEYVVATNTGRNAITRMNSSDNSITSFRYDDYLWDRLSRHGSEGAHYNSIFFHQGFIYVLAHNFEKGSFVLKLSWPSMELQERHPIAGVKGAHNFWIDEDGRWIICDSANGTLVDAKSGSVLWSNRNQGMTRGLAANAEAIFVGHSTTSNREGRISSESGIWQIGRPNWATADYHYLGHFGQVNEIRIVDSPDLCHHGALLSVQVRNQYIARRRSISAARLSTAMRDELDKNRWRIECGSIQVNAQKDMHVDADGFAICTLKGLSGAAIKATLKNASNWSVKDHASLIAHYAGPDDTNMYAALFQKDDSGNMLASIWIQDGQWRNLVGKIVPTEVLRIDIKGYTEADIEFISGPEALTLRIGNKDALSVPLKPEFASGVFGVRISGCSFTLSEPILVGEFSLGRSQ